MIKLSKVLLYGLSFILVSLIFFMLLLAVSEMPTYGDPSNPPFNFVYERYVYRGVEESGGTNLVSNVLLDYRGYDTLMESTVLFITVVAVMLVWGTSSAKEKEKEIKKGKSKK